MSCKARGPYTVAPAPEDPDFSAEKTKTSCLPAFTGVRIMNCLLIIALVALGQAESPAAPVRLFDSLIVDFEVSAYFFQNDGRYGPNGSQYTAAEVGQQRNLAIALRLAIEARIARHTVIATWAPLDLTTRATLTRDLTFKETTFADTTVVDHRYLFDATGSATCSTSCKSRASPSASAFPCRCATRLSSSARWIPRPRRLPSSGTSASSVR